MGAAGLCGADAGVGGIDRGWCSFVKAIVMKAVMMTMMMM